MARSSTRRLALGLLVVAAAAGLPTGANADYPAALPDFSAAPAGSGPDFNPTSGTLDRPTLVIYEHFSDVADPPGHDAAWLARRIFGNATGDGSSFPSVAGYFAANSFGRAVFHKVYESYGAYDGVVEVTTGTAAEHDARTEGQRNRLALTLADDFIDYSGFDANGDGTVSTRELRVLRVHTPRGTGDYCGNNRGADAGPPLDGVAVNPRVAVVGGNANLITTTHEVGHALVPRDFYGFGVGRLDLYGPTCGSPDSTLFGMDAYLKLHLGWITPTVVTRDGYYAVPRADANPAALILYDPDRGPTDYFLVENRQVAPGTYDQSASDSGLVVWRVDETQFATGSDTVRPLEIIRPDGRTNPGCPAGCYGGSNGDAWDPSDPATPQRTMSVAWRDGTPSRVAVRAIGPSGGSIRAFFDVRGPGVLVEPPADARVASGRTTTLRVPVRNTGETVAAIAVTLSGLPAGWTATTASFSLGAQGQATALIDVTTPAGTGLGLVPGARVEGRNLDVATASSYAPVDLSVVAAALVPPPPPPLPLSPPTLTAFTVAPRAFAVVTPGRRARRGRPRGTTFRFRLDRQADVVVTLDRLLAGRRRGGRCLVATRSSTGARCTVVRRAGTLTRRYRPAGANAVPFSGRPVSRPLAAGRYRATVRAATAGGASRARTTTFVVLPG